MLVLPHCIWPHFQPATNLLGAQPIDEAPEEDLLIDGIELSQTYVDKGQHLATTVLHLGVRVEGR